MGYLKPRKARARLAARQAAWEKMSPKDQQGTTKPGSVKGK